MGNADQWDGGQGLGEDELAATPWQQASSWVSFAEDRAGDTPGVHEPTAMAVATVDQVGLPDVREVLMRFFAPTGPGFVTSRHSAKAAHIAANPVLAASLTWPALFRAIRFRGAAVELPAEEVARYWSTRPWGSRIAAWASKQSHPVDGRQPLIERATELSRTWPDQGSPQDVPVPPDWVGFRIECDEVEFWAGRPNRLHDRFRFTRVGDGDLDQPLAWTWVRLQP